MEVCTWIFYAVLLERFLGPCSAWNEDLLFPYQPKGTEKFYIMLNRSFSNYVELFASAKHSHIIPWALC